MKLQKLFFVICCAVLACTTLFAATPQINYQETDPAKYQEWLDQMGPFEVTNPNFGRIAMVTVMKVYVTGKYTDYDTFKAAALAVIPNEFDKLKAYLIPMTCRNAKIFLNEAYQDCLASGVYYTPFFFNRDDIRAVLGVSADDALRITDRIEKQYHRVDLADVCLYLVQNGASEELAKTVLKRLNRHYSMLLLDDAQKEAVEPLVARIRTLLATY